jgi:hypothetical protein
MTSRSVMAGYPRSTVSATSATEIGSTNGSGYGSAGSSIGFVRAASTATAVRIFMSPRVVSLERQPFEIRQAYVSM